MKTDIIEQKEFDLLTNKNDIVITNNLKNNLVKQLDEIFEGKIKELSNEPFTTIYTLGKIEAKRVHVVNFDKLDKLKKRTKIFKSISDLKGDITVLVDTFETKETYLELMQELSEKILTNNYIFDNHKSKKKAKDKNFYFYGETSIYDAVKKGYVLGDCVNHAKDLVNTPYNYLNANDLAIYAKKLERFDNVTVEIIEKEQIEKMNMGAFLGVNLGSIEPPKLIFVKYQGKKTFSDPTALVGKGVMYDTGGYSIKTAAGMPGMKVDMAGSASVISALEAIARLELKANVMAIVAATDNRIGDNAIVPDDILVAASGKTIEIISTDAEGRLTLADAVWFAQQQGAKKVIDTATLTGAMVAALGHEFTGAFTNDTDYYKKFYKASKKAKEQVWQMPISKGYKKLIESKVADIKNTGGRLAGASTAAQFIAEFIEKDTKWIHLDIAGTASNEKKEATGVMVKTFTELFC
ncbi:MAG: Cytosol aminopeptidase [Candidatus Izimaplasma bacterium HR2]|nr:MAG: Cytosol aminopeptidase [Candidatus Izimaplasma bacterium HR2]